MTTQSHQPEDSQRGRGLLGRLVGFTGVGAIATAAQYGILLLLVTFAGSSPTVASSVGFALSALMNYCLNHRYTFRSNTLHAVALPRFATMALIGLALNALLMWLLTTRLSVHYLAAQIITTGAVLAWNFWISDRWTFR